MTIARQLTEFYGFSEQGHRGEICQSAMGRGKRCRDGSIALRRSGIWNRILGSLQQLADAEGKLNWEVHHVDGSVIRAHQHERGCKKGALDRASWLSEIEQVQQREAILTFQRRLQHQNSSTV